MSELLPCPFCGSESGPMMVCDVADWPSVVCSTSFGGCGASSGYCPAGDDNAIEAWNRRAPVQASEARGLQDAYDVGWIECTNWAKRDDLVADMDSPAYAKDRARNLAALSAHTQAGPVD